MKRFRFNGEMGKVLLQHVSTIRAHMAGYGEWEEKWEWVQAMLLVSHQMVEKLKAGIVHLLRSS